MLPFRFVCLLNSFLVLFTLADLSPAASAIFHTVWDLGMDILADSYHVTAVEHMLNVIGSDYAFASICSPHQLALIEKAMQTCCLKVSLSLFLSVL
jgi:hypothetical protein